MADSDSSAEDASHLQQLEAIATAADITLSQPSPHIGETSKPGGGRSSALSGQADDEHEKPLDPLQNRIAGALTSILDSSLAFGEVWDSKEAIVRNGPKRREHKQLPGDGAQGDSAKGVDAVGLKLFKGCAYCSSVRMTSTYSQQATASLQQHQESAQKNRQARCETAPISSLESVVVDGEWILEFARKAAESAAKSIADVAVVPDEGPERVGIIRRPENSLSPMTLVYRELMKRESFRAEKRKRS